VFVTHRSVRSHLLLLSFVSTQLVFISSVGPTGQAGRVGLGHCPSWVDRVGWGPVSKNVINMQFTRKKPITRRL